MSKYMGYNGKRSLKTWVTSRFLGKSDRAADAALLGGKQPGYYAGPPVKLSDNDNFLRPINQRGVTSATGIMPLIDRWVNYYAASIVRTNGIEISATATEQGIFQILENNPSLKGKPVTCACKYADGTLICVSGIVPPVQAYNQRFATTSENKGKAVVPAVQLLANTGYIQILLFSVCGGSDTICWAALYEGEYTADTLPPYVPSPRSVELAECRRRYLPLDASKWYEATRPYGDVLRFEVLGDFARTPTLIGSIRGFGDDGVWHDMAISSVEYRQDRTIFRIPGTSSFAKTGVAYLLTGASGVSCEP